MPVATGARLAGSLSRSGAVAAAIVGTLAVTAGLRWALLLLAFFIPSSLLSRWRAARKAERTRDMLQKSGPRDAWQVLANGGAFAAAAAGAVVDPGAAPWWLLGAGALAAATADTWSTEIGTALGGTPRSILGGRALAVGESGGVTTAGTLGGATGAAFIAACAALPEVAAGTGRVWLTLAVPVAAAGLAGTLADSLLGATVQSRRRCPACGTLTERRVHGCGTSTAHARGLPWLGNDGVNLLATLAGAGIALVTARVA